MRSCAYFPWGRFLALTLVLMLAFLTVGGACDVQLTASAFVESPRALVQPDTGMYQIVSYEARDNAPAPRFGSLDPDLMVMLQINLRAYARGAISDSGLAGIRQAFETLCAATRQQLIVRFLYDWDGKARESEPAAREIVLLHMMQVGPIVRGFADRVYVTQGLFVGNWGEISGSAYARLEDIAALTDCWLNATGRSVFVSLRTPAQWRYVTGIENAASLEPGSDAAHLALFNDGIMGNERDYGTYGYLSSWNREEELSFQQALCALVPNGGEVIIDNPLNDLETAIQTLAVMHVSYLNRDYDRGVYDKWAQSTVQEAGCFQGMDGRTYIERHLGYRYLIEEAALSPAGHGSAALASVTIRNAGFAPIYRPVELSFVLTASDGAEAARLPLAGDLRALSGMSAPDERLTLRAELDLHGMPAGEYTLWLCACEAGSQRLLEMANEQPTGPRGIATGKVVITP